jgi:hypothetical protein
MNNLIAMPRLIDRKPNLFAVLALASKRIGAFCSLLTMAGMLAGIPPAHAEDTVESAPVPVKMTVTANVGSNKRMPEISQADVLVRQGKARLEVTSWVPARGDKAGLDLFVLIDDSSDARLGLQLDELRAFIQAQPETTAVGVGYMRNAGVNIVQGLTTDHEQAAQALRLPLGNVGAYGNPYLSAVNLMDRWPDDGHRREMLMITDGIDRARRHLGGQRGFSPDADTASSVAQRTGTIIHTIYAPGAGLSYRNYWVATNGQMNMERLSDQTGGVSYFLGIHSPVSFKPYLDSLQQVFDNQYLLSFSATPGKKAGLQNIKLSTEVAGVELATHDAVWVPAVK